MPVLNLRVRSKILIPAPSPAHYVDWELVSIEEGYKSVACFIAAKVKEYVINVLENPSISCVSKLVPDIQVDMPLPDNYVDWKRIAITEHYKSMSEFISKTVDNYVTIKLQKERKESHYNF